MQRSFMSVLLFAFACSSGASAKNANYTFYNGGQDYQYTVQQTGENYTFKFDKSPEEKLLKIDAGRDVLLSIYKDASINQTYTESYIKERARCYVFDSLFYTYSLCFLPNDFDTKNQNRFWGFVTQVPNWKWLLSRFFIPVLLAFTLFLYVGRRKKS